MATDRMTAGDTLALAFSLIDAEGAPLDLTGASVRWVLRKMDYALVLEKTVVAGVIVTDAAGGRIEVQLSEVDTAALVGAHRHGVSVGSGTDSGTTIDWGGVNHRLLIIQRRV